MISLTNIKVGEYTVVSLIVENNTVDSIKGLVIADKIPIALQLDSYSVEKNGNSISIVDFMQAVEDSITRIMWIISKPNNQAKDNFLLPGESLTLNYILRGIRDDTVKFNNDAIFGIIDSSNVWKAFFSYDTNSWELIIHPLINIIGHETSKFYNLTISPNPVRDVMTIELNVAEYSTSIKITIYNLLGQRFFNKSFNLQSNNLRYILNLANFPSGLYFMKIESLREKPIVKKFIINRGQNY